jgi:hypothetical protein
MSITSFSQQTVNTGLANPAGSGNVIINGGFDIWQRGTAVTNCNAGVFLADRWAPNGFQNNRVSRVTIAAGSGPSSQFAIRSATRGDATRAVINQKIESANAIPFRGRTVTLSFWLRHSATSWTSSSGTSFGDFDYLLGWNTTTTNSSVITDLWDSSSSSSIAAGSFPTTFTKYKLTATVPGNANNINVRFQMRGDGTAANDAFWYEVTDVQLEAGTTATSFSRAGGTIQGELAACQRYCQVLGVSGVGMWFSTTTCQITWPLLVEMRVSPSVTLTTTTPSVSDAGVANRVGSGSTFSIDTSSTTGIKGNINGFSSATNGRVAQVQQAGIIRVEAEL